MEYRQLGGSGLGVSTLILGTATFGGVGEFSVWGNTDIRGARRLIDIALDAGVNMVDTADSYSEGQSEELVGRAIEGRRDRVLVATKAGFPMGDDANGSGLSRHHLVQACEDSLRRLRTDYIDLLFMHRWDGQTPLEETLGTLDMLVRAGKVRYIGCSNFAGWQLMKAMAVSARCGYERFVAQQIYLSLESRDAEYELIPAAIDQYVGTLVWSPLAGGLLSGKYRRGVRPEGTSRHLSEDLNEPPVADERALYDTVEVLVDVAERCGAEVAQVALAWLLGRPGVTGLVIGARDEKQLTSNLAAGQLILSDADSAALERISRGRLPYPLWHQVANDPQRFGAADLSALAPFLES
jgi:aryl-alcohol dehydrogenase-like predicted oxidoreductase